jgi:hypothetical protein
MKIYDCFTFYNELDLLDLRLEEHFDYVDYFVIAEANKTHQGRDKPYFLEENWNRYKNFHDKIIHIKVDDMPTHPNAWVPENFQRNALSRGLKNANPEDIMVVSDMDELIRSDTFNVMRNTEFNLYTGRSPMFYFKLNYMMIQPNAFFINAVASRVKNGFSPQDLRNMTNHFANLPYNFIDQNLCTIQHAGWHFTYFGDTVHAANKLRNFAHQESNHWADKVNVDEIISRKGGIDPSSTERFEYISIDNYFPQTVFKNQDRWKNYIIPNATASIKNYLPGL